MSKISCKDLDDEGIRRIIMAKQAVILTDCEVLATPGYIPRPYDCMEVVWRLYGEPYLDQFCG